MVRHLAIVAPPLAGHWDPLRVLALALVRRGVRVSFVHLGEAQRLLGDDPLDLLPVGALSLQHYEQVLARADSVPGVLAMIRETARFSEMLLQTLPNALAAAGIDGVIADSTEAAGSLVARHLGLPFVTTVTGLPLLQDPRLPPPYVDWPYRRGFLANRRNKGGWRVTRLLMRPIDAVAERYANNWGLDQTDLLSPRLIAAQCPPGLDFPRSTLPAQFRYLGPWRRPGSTDLPRSDGRPLIYCSLGSLQGGRRELFAQMAQACAALGTRAVIAHGGRLSEEDASALPGDPIVRAFFHQPSVLPQCAAAILHAGFNTVVDALAAGLPMVVVPLAFEQPGTAARVEWAGAAVRLDPRRLDALRLGEALRTVLEQDSYRRAAGALKQEIAGLGGVEQAADLTLSALNEGAATTAFRD